MLVETVNAIGSTVTGAIQKAAEVTGAGFSYLLATAKIESGLKPEVKASTSSATGLFQFIDQTWLMTMKQSGTDLGLGRYADAIEKTASGRYVVRDPAMRAEILNLRKNPSINAAMAGALTRLNAARLRSSIGRDPTEGELYIAHFLGAGGATRLINAAATNPNMKAAALFPRAAVANHSIFYDQSGAARSVSGVYGMLVTKLARAMPSPDTTQVATSAPAPSGATGLFSPARTANVAANVPMPPLAASVAPHMFTSPNSSNAKPLGAASSDPTPDAPPLAFAADGSGFYDLFRTDGRGAVSQTVSALWGGRSPTSSQPQSAIEPAAAPTSGNDSAGRRGFDLFSSPAPQS